MPKGIRKILVIHPKEIHDLAKEKGWYDQERPTPELLCLVHAEVSEALEAYRRDIKEGEKGWIGEELADVVIRVFDLAENLNIDISDCMDKKHAYNKTRGYRHGGKKC